MSTDYGTRLEAAKDALVACAQQYVESGPSETIWRELCRAKATIDALTRCAR